MLCLHYYRSYHLNDRFCVSCFVVYVEAGHRLSVPGCGIGYIKKYIISFGTFIKGVSGSLTIWHRRLSRKKSICLITSCIKPRPDKSEAFNTLYLKYVL